MGLLQPRQRPGEIHHQQRAIAPAACNATPTRRASEGERLPAVPHHGNVLRLLPQSGNLPQPGASERSSRRPGITSTRRSQALKGRPKRNQPGLCFAHTKRLSTAQTPSCNETALRLRVPLRLCVKEIPPWRCGARHSLVRALRARCEDPCPSLASLRCFRSRLGHPGFHPRKPVALSKTGSFPI
jgi:hypothetical protein